MRWKRLFIEIIAWLSLATLLAFASFARGQPVVPSVPKDDPPIVPKVIVNTEKVPRVIFCKIAAREIPGCEVFQDDNWTDAPSISLFALVDGEHKASWRYYGQVNDATIRRDLGLEVQAARPVPFREPPVVDGNPWLSRAETEKIMAMLPAGVPVGKGVRFYKLAPVYQNMYTMNGGRSKLNVITQINEVPPWRDSGGLHHVDRKEWRNITGLDLPGNIEYWQEDTDVRAFSLVPKWRWRFPKGTLAYDVLVRIKNGEEHVFEVRVHEKTDDSWDEGTTYRPQAEPGETSEYTWGFASEGLNAKAFASIGKIDPKAKFRQTRSLVVDDDFTPPKYVGAGMACNTCHSRVGLLYDVPGRIYREARRGDDGRFSWHPFDESGNLDTRWPIERKK